MKIKQREMNSPSSIKEELRGGGKDPQKENVTIKPSHTMLRLTLPDLPTRQRVLLKHSYTHAIRYLLILYLNFRYFILGRLFT